MIQALKRSILLIEEPEAAMRGALEGEKPGSLDRKAMAIRERRPAV